jgi:Replication-relaxation
VEESRKCSLISARRYRLTDRHVLMLQALADHKALTGKHLTDLFFGSVRRCQVHVAYLKRLGLIKETTGLPRPQRGSAPPVYALTAAGARVVDRDGRSLLMRTYRNLVGSDLHLRHTIAVNDFFTKLLTAARSQGGHLEWLGEDACRAYYADVHAHIPQLTPDGAGTLRLGSVETRFFLELDRGTERQGWLRQKYRRYLLHLAGRVGAEALHVLFVVPDGRRERLLHKVGQAALRGAASPHPGFWTATQNGLRLEGSLGAAWARVSGWSGKRARLSEIGRPGPPLPSLSLPVFDSTTDFGLKAA